MHNVTATLSILREYSKRAGIALPDGLSADLERLDVDPGSAHLELDRAALARDVTAAMEAGKDPAKVPAVQAHVTRWALAQLGIKAATAEARDRDRANTLERHTPALIAAWAPALRDAGEAIATIIREVPGVDLTNPASADRVPAPLLETWRAARDGIGTIGHIVTMWGVLTGAAGDKRYRPLVVAPLDADQLDALGFHPEPWRAATVARLELATPETYTARVERINQGRQAQAHARDEAFRERSRIFGGGSVARITV
ncbi:hypothetical protein [Georgenia muralis]